MESQTSPGNGQTAAKPNITKDKTLAIKNIRKDDNIIILPADKANATVVMNKAEYTTKLETLVNDGTYSKLKRNPAPNAERRHGHGITIGTGDGRHLSGTLRGTGTEICTVQTIIVVRYVGG